LSLQVPVTANIQRPKAMFYFYSPLQTVFDSPRISDTTQVSTISTTRVTLKTYSLTLPTGANTVRVLVYGYVSNYSAFGGRVYVNIDGTDVASVTTISATTETVLIDYIGSITPGAHTINIDGMAEAPYQLFITRVYIITGIGLTSTTLTNLITFSVTYQLLRSGDIRYSPGVRVFIWGNRKTTAPTTLQVGSSPTTGRNNLGAGNDNTVTEVFLAIVTGSVTLQEGGEYRLNVTLRGAVGASGNTVIITRIQARAQLKRETHDLGEVRVYERGVCEYSARALLVSVPGGVTSTIHHFLRKDIKDDLLVGVPISSGGSDVMLYNFRVPVVAPIHFITSGDGDYHGEAYLEWIQVVVWG
jgi:hypothetical protein